MNEITVNEITYEIERETSRSDGSETFTLPDFPGIEARFGYEESGELFSPRDWDNVSTICVSYRGYDLGDEDIRKINFTDQCETCDGEGDIEYKEGERDEAGTIYGPNSGNYYPCPACKGHGEIAVSPIAYFKREHGSRVVLPLIVYEHSGITMKVGHVGDILGDAEGWDTSFVGFVYDTPEAVKGCIGEDATDEQIEAALRQEIKTYAAYLEGDATWWCVEDPESNYFESCGGYVGDQECAKNDLELHLRDCIEQRLKENAERAYWLDRGVMTA